MIPIIPYSHHYWAGGPPKEYILCMLSFWSGESYPYRTSADARPV